MKKVIVVLFAVLLVLGLSFPIFAENTTWYYIEDLEIAVPIPDDMTFLSRDLSADDPQWDELGVTKEEVVAVYEEYDIYFQYRKRDLSYSSSIIMTPSSYKDMSDFSEADYGDFIYSILNDFDGAEVGDMLRYETSQGTFLQFSIYTVSNSTEVFNLYYITVYHGKKIEIVLYAQDTPPTTKQKSEMNAIVDDIYFGTEEEIFGGDPPAQSGSKTSSTVSTAAFTYTDQAVGTSFTVPANWSQEAVSGEDAYVTAVFVLNEDNDMAIIYGSEDQWLTEFSELGGGITREDINNDYFSPADIEERLDFQTSVSVKYIGGVKYFQFTTHSGNRVSTSMIMYHNAVFYWFEFYGDENNKYYGDFMSLLKSVKYPGGVIAGSSAGTSSVSSGAPVAADGKTPAGGHTWIYIAFAAVLLALPILVYRYAVRRRPVDSKHALLIVLIYGGVSLAVMSTAVVVLNDSWVAVGIVLLWHIASYFVLTQGRQMSHQINMTTAAPAFELNVSSMQRQTDPGGYTQTGVASVSRQTDVQDDHPLYCEMCGMKLRPGSKFCPNCGEKIE